MPIFTYKCKECGEVFDFLMLLRNEKAKCLKCGSEKIEKQISVFGVPSETSVESTNNCKSKRT